MTILPQELKIFAFMQDEQGLVPLTIGKQYEAFGLRKNIFGEFIFVVRDGESLPWWMPKTFFEEKEISLSPSWVKEEYDSPYGGKAVEYAPRVYFDNEEAIEDGTDEGYKAFARMRNSL